MKPTYTVTINGTDLTGKIRDRRCSVTVQDAAGDKADTVRIEFDNRDGAIAEPPDGASIVVSMGYEGGLILPLGVFVLDGIDYQFAPDRMIVSGKSAEFGGSLKDQKTREWNGKTIEEIVTTIAGEHGREGKVSEALAGYTYEALTQKAESDISFLSRIAKDHDALAAVKEQTILFMGRGEGRSVSGLSLPQLIIKKDQLMPGSTVRKNKAATYKSVRAIWHNEATGDKEEVVVGDGSPRFEITHPHKSQDEAKRAAQSKLDEEARKAHAITLKLVGDPMRRAVGQLALIGMPAGVPLVWSIKSVKHAIGSGGYTNTIIGELPKVDGAGQ